MSSNYLTQIVDWSTYVAGPEEGEDETEFDLRLEEFMYDDGVVFPHDNAHWLGLASFEIYESISSLLSVEQQKLLERFLGSLMSDFFPFEENTIDALWEPHADYMFAAIEPSRIAALDGTFAKIELRELKEAATSSPLQNPLFSAEEFMCYIAAWGKLVSVAAACNGGLLVMWG